MRTKIKITAIIIVTFALGLVLGGAFSRALIHKRIEKTFSRGNPAFLSNVYMDILQPDEEQAEEIKKILDTHVKQMLEMRGEFANKMRLSWESLQKEMDPFLTPEQKKRMEEAPLERMRQFRRFPNQKHPFPGKPPRRNFPPNPHN